jgi:hypothetical protein
MALTTAVLVLIEISLRNQTPPRFWGWVERILAKLPLGFREIRILDENHQQVILNLGDQQLFLGFAILLAGRVGLPRNTGQISSHHLRIVAWLTFPSVKVHLLTLATAQRVFLTVKLRLDIRFKMRPILMLLLSVLALADSDIHRHSKELSCSVPYRKLQFPAFRVLGCTSGEY